MCDSRNAAAYSAEECTRLYGGVCPDGEWRGPCEGAHNLLECRPCASGGGDGRRPVSPGIPHNSDTCGWCGRNASSNGTVTKANNSAVSRGGDCVRREVPWFLGASLGSGEFVGCLAGTICLIVTVSAAAVFSTRAQADFLFLMARLGAFYTWWIYDTLVRARFIRFRRSPPADTDSSFPVQQHRLRLVFANASARGRGGGVMSESVSELIRRLRARPCQLRAPNGGPEPQIEMSKTRNQADCRQQATP